MAPEQMDRWVAFFDYRRRRDALTLQHVIPYLRPLGSQLEPENLEYLQTLQFDE